MLEVVGAKVCRSLAFKEQDWTPLFRTWVLFLEISLFVKFSINPDQTQVTQATLRSDVISQYRQMRKTITYHWKMHYVNLVT